MWHWTPDEVDGLRLSFFWHSLEEFKKQADEAAKAAKRGKSGKQQTIEDYAKGR